MTTACCCPLVIVVALAATPAFAQGPAGEWSSSEGRLTFVVQADGTVRGEYPYASGRIIGRVQGLRLVAYWHQETSRQRCATMRSGTYYWGRVVMTFSTDWARFTGNWNYCGEEPADGWNGERRAAPAPQMTELQFGRRERGQFRPYAVTEPMPSDRPFVVRVRYDVEPPFHQTGVTLTWAGGGKHRLALFKTQADPTIFESRDTVFEDPAACRGLTFCTGLQGVFGGR